VTRSELRAFRSAALGVAWRTVHNALTTPNIVIPTLAFPFFFFVAFAGGLSQLQHLPGFHFSQGYTAFQFVFVMLQSAAFGGVFTGFGIARDFEYGFARRLMLAAPYRGALLLGYAISAVVRWAVVATLLTVAAFAVGMQVGGGGVELPGLYGLAVIVNAAALLWSAGVAMRLRTIQAGPAMQMPVFLALFFAPVYVPLTLLSGWIHHVAQANPVTYFLEAGRSFVSGDTTHALLAFGSAIGLAVLFSIWAFRGLRSAEEAGG
jgi:ABC-type multidrug transport system permease subunit